MKTRYILMMALGACSLGIQASVRDTARVERYSLWNQVELASANQNPAIHGVAYAHSYSELYVQLDHLHQTAPFVQEKGTGFLLGEAKVETFLKLNHHSSVWGAASYMTGKQYQVRWNSTSDYELLYPYVLADTLGGDTKRERYSFHGGYSTRWNHVLLGAEALFRAEHEYRDVDPRMRGVVTDLLVRLGSGYETSGYRYGLGMDVNVYKQTNDVDFYRELGVIPEFQMTGLGTEYSRFSGDKRTLYYKGGGWGLMLSADPLRQNGVYGSVKVGNRQYKRMVADLNSTPITQLFVDAADMTMGWRREGRRLFALDGNLHLVKRSGDENIIGQSSSQYYPVIGKLTMYKNTSLDANLRVLYGLKAPVNTWNVQAKAGVWSNHEKYVYPERKMNDMKVYGSVEGQWMRMLNKQLGLLLSMDVSHYAHVDSDILMPFANMTASFADMIRYKYRFAKANYTLFNAKVRGDYALSHSQIGLFAEVAGGMALCSEKEQQTQIHVALGISF